MKKHKGLKIALLVILALVLGLFAGAWSMFGQQIKAASSVKKLDEGLYYLEYEGDYGFADYLKQGGAPTDAEMAKYITSFLSHGFYELEDAQTEELDYGCSTLYAENEEGGYLMGRNFDWTKCEAIIVHTKPEDGYESYSTCNMEFLGFGDGWKPEGFINQYIAIASIYVPVDGMNEKGLMIADLMAGDAVVTHQDTEKPDLTTTAAIRAMLDYAANVEEALEILEQYDMNSAIGAAHHYAIADASGNSVVVEYVENEMVVTETDVLTNHYLAKAKYGVGNSQSKTRFQILQNRSQQYDGVLTQEIIKDAMSDVCQSNYVSTEATQWTILYNTKDLSLEYFWQEDYETSEIFYLNK